MGHRIIKVAFYTKEEAEQHQKTEGVQGYSEFYARGISEYVNIEGKYVYVSEGEEYYG
jgi:hypothetical protein